MLKKTLDEAYYWAAFHKEKKMYAALDSVKEKLDEEFNNNQEIKAKENKEIENKTEEKKEGQKTLFDIT